MIQLTNPTSDEIKNLNKNSVINFAQINKIVQETNNFLKNNSLKNCKCKCKQVYNVDKQKPTTNTNKHSIEQVRVISSSAASSSSSYPDQDQENKMDDYFSMHRPSEQFLVDFFKQFQQLFDVDCFLNAQTKLNDLYYKHGRLVNFKNAIQNIFDSSIQKT